MDMKHSFPAPELRKISALQSSDSVHLVLIHGDSSIHLRRFTDLEETELLEIIDIDLDHLYQLDAFLMNSQWCLLLAGSSNSFIYCLQGTNSFISQFLTPLTSVNLIIQIKDCYSGKYCCTIKHLALFRGCVFSKMESVMVTSQ